MHQTPFTHPVTISCIQFRPVPCVPRSALNSTWSQRTKPGGNSVPWPLLFPRLSRTRRIFQSVYYSFSDRKFLQTWMKYLTI